jgi:predicted RNase H-like nuclease (RuvC/YqgF family)
VRDFLHALRLRTGRELDRDPAQAKAAVPGRDADGDEKLREIEATESELRMMSHLRDVIAQNYKSYEEIRDKYKNELRVMEARMRAFKYEEDTLREFAE